MKNINIGFIGLGNMGSRMCLNIIRNSYKVTVHDINRESAFTALEMGASWADSPKEISEKCWKIPDEFFENRYPEIIHGVGLADEYPIIYHFDDFEIKKYDGIIEPGMTLCVESYIGSLNGREGVKLEEQVLVTDSGVERLSNYPFQLDLL